MNGDVDPWKCDVETQIWQLWCQIRPSCIVLDVHNIKYLDRLMKCTIVGCTTRNGWDLSLEDYSFLRPKTTSKYSFLK